MNRRDVFAVGAAVALGPTIASASAKAQGALPSERKATDAQLRALAREASACVAAGEACLDHCLRRLGEGDKSMAACAEAVRDMIAVCQATASLASSHSSQVTLAAKLCIATCDACENACAPHAKHHKECGACAEACKKTSTAASKLGA